MILTITITFSLVVGMEVAGWLLGEQDEVPHTLYIRKSIPKKTQT